MLALNVVATPPASTLHMLKVSLRSDSAPKNAFFWAYAKDCVESKQVTYVGWNVYDGLPERKSGLSRSQAENATDGLPSITEYLGPALDLLFKKL